METDRGERAEGRTPALWATAPARVRGQQKGADRTVAGIGRRSNYFKESVRRKMGARGIRAYRLRADAGAGFDVDGEMGQKTQKAHAKENGEASRLDRERRIFGGGSFSEVGYSFVFGAGKEFCVSEWRALDDFARAFIVAGEFCANREVGAAFDEQLGDRQSPVAILGYCVEDCRLSADSLLTHRCAGVYVGAAIEKSPGSVEVPVLGCNMKQC